MAYQETYTERPSNEIQTTLNLLFKEKERGLYTHISPPPVPIHARHKLRLCVPKFHLILIN
jgi:hypothetical protein